MKTVAQSLLAALDDPGEDTRLTLAALADAAEEAGDQAAAAWRLLSASDREPVAWEGRWKWRHGGCSEKCTWGEHVRFTRGGLDCPGKRETCVLGPRPYWYLKSWFEKEEKVGPEPKGSYVDFDSRGEAFEALASYLKAEMEKVNKVADFARE